MNDVFVTGGSGFVGRHLIAELVDRNVAVTGLARSDESAATVRSVGGTVVRGDLSAVEPLREGMAGCDLVVHAAAKVDWSGEWATFEAVNVRGTDNVLRAAREAGVDRLVHVSTESALLDGSPLVDVDETHPIPDEPVGHYGRSKALAERAVRAANDGTLSTVVVRPRFIWGAGDTTLLPEMVEAVESGSFVWFDGGRYLTSTCHVHNVVEGILLAAEHGNPGEVYFLTDGDPVEFREFVTDLLATQGVTPPDRSVPTWLANPLARLADVVWDVTPGLEEPPISRSMLATIGQEITLDDSKARADLGYAGTVSKADGLAALRDEYQV